LSIFRLRSAFFRALRLVALCLVALFSAQPALAHPHIFIDATAELVFDDSGRLASVTNHWTFDAAFSVWMVEGLERDGSGRVLPAELAAIATEHMEGLAQYRFYTFAGEGETDLRFDRWHDETLVFADNRVTLSFTVDLAEPHAVTQLMELAINDPEYYVAITFAGPESIRLVNAPDSCVTRLEPPSDMPDWAAAELFALPPDVTELPQHLAVALRGVQGAILLSCDGFVPPPATTAAEAAEAMATPPRAVPFGGPPPEPGFALPRSGFLGWVDAQQRGFYQALNAALERLASDYTAFWVLGGLSFLYGVFHAAGPGHGKVVITSYMLANESQLRQGVLLSLLAAMLQSVVAIAIVLAGVLVLGATSTAMGYAAHWIGLVSYGAVMALGLWLMARKIFGFGHHHHDAPAHHHDHHDHHHHHDDDHHEHAPHHAVVPSQLTGDWRERAGVVFAAGLRPCTGALVVLVFSVSQGLLPAGIAAVFLMGLGTAITVGVLAGLAVGAKGLTRRLLGASGGLAGTFIWWTELLGAFIVFAFGLVLLLASL
jgi:nickel/cobalt exporter